MFQNTIEFGCDYECQEKFLNACNALPFIINVSITNACQYNESIFNDNTNV